MITALAKNVDWKSIATSCQFIYFYMVLRICESIQVHMSSGVSTPWMVILLITIVAPSVALLRLRASCYNCLCCHWLAVCWLVCSDGLRAAYKFWKFIPKFCSYSVHHVYAVGWMVCVCDVIKKGNTKRSLSQNLVTIINSRSKSVGTNQPTDSEPAAAQTVIATCTQAQQCYWRSHSHY